MNTDGPAINFLTSCWLLPQNEQYSSLLSPSPLCLSLITFASALPEPHTQSHDILAQIYYNYTTSLQQRQNGLLTLGQLVHILLHQMHLRSYHDLCLLLLFRSLDRYVQPLGDLTFL
jgi:hypothetical protein